MNIRKLQKRYTNLIEGARWALWWEDIWPILWRWIALGSLFAGFSWLGLWTFLSGTGRMTGVIGFLILFILFAIVPFFRLHLPTRQAAQNRMERDSALKHSPVHAVEDQLFLGSKNKASQELWALHMRKALESIPLMTVRLPSPGLPQKDPFALRFILVLGAVLAGFYAGEERIPRLMLAFNWQSEAELTGLARTTGWVAPPAYTGEAAFLLDFSKKGRKFSIPIHSRIVVRAGSKDTYISVTEGLKPVEAETETADSGQVADNTDNNVHIYQIEKDGELTASAGWFSFRTFQFETRPDHAPYIELEDSNDAIKQDYKGAFTLSYRTADDYGVAELYLDIKPDPSLKSVRSLVPPPQVALLLPPDSRTGNQDNSKNNIGKTDINISDHPWSGAPVIIKIIAVDHFGNKSESAPFPFILPEKRFMEPISAALAEQRRKTVLFPDNPAPVQIALDALMIEPEIFTPDIGIYMGLYDVSGKLRRASGDENLLSFSEDLWALIQAIEGDQQQLADAKSALRQAQERLQDAIARGASEDEIKQLTKEYENAMNRYMRELARQSKKEEQQRDQVEKSGKTENITRAQLNSLLKDIEEAMKRGDVLEAQRLMEELAEILENLQIQTAEGNGDDSLNDELSESTKELNELLRQQQQLQDETFNEDRKRQESQRLAPPSETQKPSKSEDLAERQKRLRERMQQLQQEMKRLGMQKEQRFSEAEENMEKAGKSLEKGDLQGATESQKEALKNMERGARNFARQKHDMMEAEKSGQQQNGEPAQNGESRQTGSANPFDAGKDQDKDLELSPTSRAQKIIEELRNKLSEPERPEEELNYFERLLKVK